MKRFLSVLLSLTLLVSCSFALAGESYIFNDVFSVSTESIDNIETISSYYYVFMGNDMIVLMTGTAENIGSTAETMNRLIASGGVEKTLRDFLGDDNAEYREIGSAVACVGQNDGDSLGLIYCDNCLLYCISSTVEEGMTPSEDALWNFFTLLEINGSNSSAESSPTSMPGADRQYTLEDLEGYYDCYYNGEITTDAKIFLTKQGYMRGTGNSGFTCHVQIQGNQIVNDSGDNIFTISVDGNLVMTSYGMEISFMKRAPIQGDTNLSGTWECTEICSNGTSYNQSTINLLGLGITFIAYPSGAIDWIKIASGETEQVAQGWGFDEKGVYINNGNICYLEMQGNNQLKLTIKENSYMVFTHIFDE